MPEEKKEEFQEEFGWEDLTSNDGGRRDMGEIAPEPAQQGDQETPAETPTEAAPEPTAPAVEPTGEAAELPEGTDGATPPETVHTLPGGKKVTHSELISNPDLLSKLVTHSNQLTHANTLAEERKTELDTERAEKRKLLDQFTEWEMKQRLADEQQDLPQETPQRPEAKVLEGVYAPHLDQLVADGRISKDQRSEFGNVLSEYMFDQQNTHNMITAVAQGFGQEIAAIREQLHTGVVPDIQRRQQQDAASLDRTVQQEIAAQTGYEALAQPEEWNRLKSFIGQKVNASPKDAEGNPTFDPMFDAETMRQMYDAMTGGDTRAMLLALQKAQEEKAQQTATLAGGETSSKAGSPPIKQPSQMTPEEEAMDFRDPQRAAMATG